MTQSNTYKKNKMKAYSKTKLRNGDREKKADRTYLGGNGTRAMWGLVSVKNTLTISV